MKKLPFIIILFFSLQLVAQKRSSELGLMGGGSYYLGDLNPLMHFLGTKPAGGIFFRYNLNPRYSLKLNGYYGTVTGSDRNSRELALQQRGLSFRSRIMEVGGNFEFNFLPYITGDEKKRFSPYLFIGLALFHFSPQASLNNQWYDLQAVGTEGQGSFAYKSDRYKLTQVSIPFGMGLKYSLSNRLCVGAEWGLRKTYTDYIDDVSTVYADPRLILAEQGPDAAILSDPTILASDPYNAKTGRQRGGSRTRDWYAFAGIMLSFKLGQQNPCAAYNHF